MDNPVDIQNKNKEGIEYGIVKDGGESAWGSKKWWCVMDCFFCGKPCGYPICDVCTRKGYRTEDIGKIGKKKKQVQMTLKGLDMREKKQ